WLQGGELGLDAAAKLLNDFLRARPRLQRLDFLSPFLQLRFDIVSELRDVLVVFRLALGELLLYLGLEAVELSGPGPQLSLDYAGRRPFVLHGCSFLPLELLLATSEPVGSVPQNSMMCPSSWVVTEPAPKTSLALHVSRPTFPYAPPVTGLVRKDRDLGSSATQLETILTLKSADP